MKKKLVVQAVLANLGKGVATGIAIALSLPLPAIARPSPQQFFESDVASTDYRWQVQQAVCLQNWQAAIDALALLLASAQIAEAERSQLLADRAQWVRYHHQQIRFPFMAGCDAFLAAQLPPPSEPDLSSAPENFNWEREIRMLQSQIQSQNVTVAASRQPTSVLRPPRRNLLAGNRRQSDRRCQARLSICQ
ncbi:MAG: hypothetical protein ACTS3T_01820 [Almyronema sp.]